MAPRSCAFPGREEPSWITLIAFLANIPHLNQKVWLSHFYVKVIAGKIT